MTGQPTVKPGLILRAGLWAALAFVLNLAWEIAHVSLYTIWDDPEPMRIARALLHCSLGDVAIALAIYALPSIALRRTDWTSSRPWTGGIIATIGAVAYTAWSEWYNVYIIGSWGYTADMPTLLGIGWSPLLQWLILPPLTVISHRRLGTTLLRRYDSRCPIHVHEHARSLK